jgi:acetate kinase
LYGLPYRYYRDFKIRRYGFHGTSHKYVSEEAARHLGVPVGDLKIITCHLGNGCSMTAVDGGVSVDTSLGFTPLEGLVMGTRCGDIDPAIITYLLDRKLAEPGDLDRILNKESGLLGLAGIGSSDMRDVAAAALSGNRQAQTAERLFCYRVRKYIGAYAAAMGGLDVLIFTAGIGENSPRVRRLACEGLGGVNGLGITIDDAKNEAPGRGVREIQGGGRVKVLVVPTHEELEIARQTVAVLGSELLSGQRRGEP